MFYIGRKSFYSYSKKKLTPAEKLLPENKRKTFTKNVDFRKIRKFLEIKKPLHKSTAVLRLLKKILLTILVVSSLKIGSDGSRRISFDVVSFKHVYQFSVFEKRYTW